MGFYSIAHNGAHCIRVRLLPVEVDVQIEEHDRNSVKLVSAPESVWKWIFSTNNMPEELVLWPDMPNEVNEHVTLFVPPGCSRTVVLERKGSE